MSTAAPNITITKGKSRDKRFIVFGPGGPTRPASQGGPDIDVTTVVDAAHLGVTGTDGTATLVPNADGTIPSRTVRFSATGPGTGTAKFSATVTARGRAAQQFVNVDPAPDLSDVVWDETSLTPEIDIP